MRKPCLNLGIFFLLMAISVCLAGSTVWAVTYVVNREIDDPAEGSLRYAVNNAVSGDVISFQLEEYPETILLDGDTLVITHGMTIQGPGAELLSISGGDETRVFQVSTTEPVNISGISIIDGRTYDGAGLYCGASSRLTITDCIFSNNEARYDGGGMFCPNANPVINNCIFTQNSADRGSGIYIGYGSSPTITGCIFSENSAGDVGGGIYNYQSDPTVTDCTFSGNSTYSGGGGICNYQSNPAVTGCTFSENTTSSDYGTGGGIFNFDSSPEVTNCTFSWNSAPSQGGGMFNSGSSPEVTNCTFYGNYSVYGTGGMFNEQSDPVITNCTFTENSGGLIGGMHFDWSGNSIVTNSIFWGNSGTINEIHLSNATLNISNCIVESDDIVAGATEYLISSDIISADPLLQPLADNGGPTWTCAIVEGSSAIDAGVPIAGVSTDQRGVLRPQGESFDIGAYEYLANALIDLSLVKSVDNETPKKKDLISFTIEVTNDGETDATGVSIRDYLPDCLLVLEESISPDSNLILNDDTIEWSGLEIESGSSSILTFGAEVLLNKGEYDNCAEVYSATQEDSDSLPGDMTGDDYDCVTLTLGKGGNKDKDKDQDEDDDDDDDLTSSSAGTDGGGSDIAGGGCNTGTFVPTLLFLIAPLLFLKRKR